MVHKKYPDSILGPWGKTSLDKVPVAKVLFISLQVSNKFLSEKLQGQDRIVLWLKIWFYTKPGRNTSSGIKFCRFINQPKGRRASKGCPARPQKKMFPSPQQQAPLLQDLQWTKTSLNQANIGDFMRYSRSSTSLRDSLAIYSQGSRPKKIFPIDPAVAD